MGGRLLGGQRNGSILNCEWGGVHYLVNPCLGERKRKRTPPHTQPNLCASRRHRRAKQNRLFNLFVRRKDVQTMPSFSPLRRASPFLTFSLVDPVVKKKSRRDAAGFAYPSSCYAYKTICEILGIFYWLQGVYYASCSC